jgi:hypothetical protein
VRSARRTEVTAQLLLCPVEEVPPEIENVDGSVTVNLIAPPIDCSPEAQRSAPCPLVEAWAVAWATAPRTAPVDVMLEEVDALPLADAVALYLTPTRRPRRRRQRRS